MLRVVGERLTAQRVTPRARFSLSQEIEGLQAIVKEHGYELLA
jgi:hypothetical protein